MTPDQVADAATEFLAGKFEPAVEQVLAEVESEIRALIATAFPPASLPGQPPHRRSGDYRSSWAHHVVRVGETIRGEVGTTEDLGVWLEEGTERMAARPHVRPTYDRLRPTIVDRVKSKL